MPNTLNRPMSRPTLALLTLLASPAAAQDALTWLETGIGMPTTRHDAGIWAAPGGQIWATDALTLWQTGADVPLINVPDATARVIGLLDAETGRTAVMALIWSDVPVTCGHDLSTIGVDTGTAAFVTPDDLPILTAYGERYGTLYAGTYAEQLDATVPTTPFLANIPGGATFPATGTGWGDGGYPVASLLDAEGNIAALYAVFMGGTEDWLLPTPCTGATS